MWNEKWKELLNDTLVNGKLVKKKNNGDYLETLGHKFILENPRDRLISDNIHPTNIFQCIGQFLWITQGNFNLEAIKYYQPIAEKFSSDGWKMIGAYGPRLFGIQHLNQIQHVFETLHEDSTKRKAVASVYLPQFDQHKKNDEVPCTLNLQYLIRDGKLNAITFMRSQNAYNLLPIDLFIFTMLQEYVTAYLQAEYDLELGTYYHFSGSFHIYTRSQDEITRVINNKSTNNNIMEEMPWENVEVNINKLNQFEKVLRTTIVAHERRNVPVDFDFFLGMMDDLPKNEYWRQLALVLMCYGAYYIDDNKNLERFNKMLNTIYQYYVKLFLETYGIKTHKTS